MQRSPKERFLRLSDNPQWPLQAEGSTAHSTTWAVRYLKLIAEECLSSDPLVPKIGEFEALELIVSEDWRCKGPSPMIRRLRQYHSCRDHERVLPNL
jgi:hypothetical protein